MAINSDIDLQTIIRTFAAECVEHIADMEQAAIALEAQPDDNKLLETIFRAAHTIKGNAASLGFLSLADFTHRLEDFLQRFRDDAKPLTKQSVTLLLQSFDALSELVADATAGSDALKPHQVILRKQLSEGQTGVGQPRSGSRGENRDAPEPQGAEPGLGTVGRKRDELTGVADHSGTVRVDIEKLDRILNLAGEIAVAQGRLRQALNERQAVSVVFEAHEQLQRLSLSLQEDIMKLRMVRASNVFGPYIRVARDVASAAGKEAHLVIAGEDAEIDLNLAEAIRDPLTHMIRNAIDHGIEKPDIRRTQGKNPCGLLLLRIFRDSGSMVIQLIDDGTGLDRERIITRAKEGGWIADTENISDHELSELLFQSGFSTAGQVTDLSGRGVGMDIVRRNVEALHGTVHLESVAGCVFR